MLCRNSWVEAIESVKDSLMEDEDRYKRDEEEEEEEEDEGPEGDRNSNRGTEYLPAPLGTTAMGPYKKKKKLVREHRLNTL